MKLSKTATTASVANTVPQQVSRSAQLVKPGHAVDVENSTLFAENERKIE